MIFLYATAIFNGDAYSITAVNMYVHTSVLSVHTKKWFPFDIFGKISVFNTQENNHKMKVKFNLG